MVDLIDRFTFNSDKTGKSKIPSDQFVSYLSLYIFQLKTMGEISDAWNLEGDEITQALLIANAINSETGTSNKLIYAERLSAVAMLLDRNDSRYVDIATYTIDKELVKSDIGF